METLSNSKFFFLLEVKDSARFNPRERQSALGDLLQDPLTCTRMSIYAQDS